MKKIIKYFSFMFLIGIFTNCSTYHISTESLVQQFIDVQPQKKKTILIAFPIFIPFTVNGNDLKEVRCLDKNEKEVTLQVTNHTGIKITKKNKKSNIFLFDTLILKDSIINGSKSHFLNLSIQPINLNDIEKIELQK